MCIRLLDQGDRRLKTLLTVDWDYFVPERPEFDLGHSESLAFLDMMWRSRVGLLDQIKADGAEIGFWDRLGASLKGAGPTYVSDSHLYAYSLLSGIDHVLLVDAHHDCWQEDSLGISKGEGKIYCHNWLRAWLGKGKRRRVTWVCPEWSKGWFEVPKDLKGRVSIVDKVEGKIDRVHVCRSGCWTPPWLDKQFIGFVESRKVLAINLQRDGLWNAMAERWTEAEFQELRDQETSVQEALRGIKTGVISSASFTGAKVELGVNP